jgi:uncharacterized protein (TIGR02647 family)
MKLNADLVDEFTLLSQFRLNSSLEGIKVHAEASKHLIDASQRLFEKGLITQFDGGYLTDLGKDAAEHLANLHTILTTPVKVDTAS